MTKIDRRYLWNGKRTEVRAQRDGDNLYVEVDGHAATFTIVPGATGAFVLQEGDRVLTGHAVARDGSVWIQIGGRTWVLETERPTRGRPATASPAANRVASPMIGTVRMIFVKAGETVEIGAALLVVEAMKMEYTVTAPADGTVTELLCEVGQSVDLGQLLVMFEPVGGLPSGRRRIVTEVRIVEVGPRDGLQNESALVPTPAKIAFVDALSRTGVSEIEVTSFVSPKWVPQLADAREVLQGITRNPAVVYSSLVPNEKGMEGALAANLRRVAVFTAASETFNRKNVNATIAESLARFEPVMKTAAAAGVTVRGYVSTAFVCPYEGMIEPEAAARVVKSLFDLGVNEVSIGDTIGAAVPTQIDALLDLLAGELKSGRLAMHFHDTRGTALANVLASLKRGVTVFDSSAGGLGGCPYAPGATGNLATEDLVYFLAGMGIECGVDLESVVAASNALRSGIGVVQPSRVLAAVNAKRAGSTP